MTSNAVPERITSLPVTASTPLSDAVRLTRQGRDPRSVLTIDHDLAEVVLLYGLTHVGYLLNRATRIPEMDVPGLIVAAGSPERVLDTASLRLFLALQRGSTRGAL